MGTAARRCASARSRVRRGLGGSGQARAREETLTAVSLRPWSKVTESVPQTLQFCGAASRWCRVCSIIPVQERQKRPHSVQSPLHSTGRFGGNCLSFSSPCRGGLEAWMTAGKTLGSPYNYRSSPWTGGSQNATNIKNHSWVINTVK